MVAWLISAREGLVGSGILWGGCPEFVGGNYRHSFLSGRWEEECGVTIRSGESSAAV